MVQFRKTEEKDLHNIHLLYRKVTSDGESLARTSSEISIDYITDIYTKCQANGINLLVEDNGLIVGEVHAYSPGLRFQSHILTDFTIAIHPMIQSSGVGRKLMNKFFHVLNTELPHIIRIDLIIRQTNKKAITFYESSGFITEGILQNRLKTLSGDYENEVLMAWTNPSFLLNSQK